jgi:hypothetical protein
MKVLNILTILGCVAGAFTFIGVFITATSAPQEGAGAAMAVAFAVIPYCFVRAVNLWDASSEKELRKINELLATHTRLLATLANAAIEQTKPESDALPTAEG